ncbi:hypothetical protein [Corynebacterium caspium]|uniref:hypothetical protein n=1 Tax=Corynebacterium caspium TaxID=234828 RepID=UPI00036DA255|nr:hypothetical protein [Corynebacterium caspium]WKD58501.1 hypothetical protein CCASP_00325 [Corynebacterium caspium DSM 44850]
MRFLRSLMGVITTATVAFSALSSPLAGAQTFVDKYPETPQLNPQLPIVETTHGSDHLKANILNPHPVCNSGEDYRTVVYKVSDNFIPAGTISATNLSANPIPLTQDLGKSQSISLNIHGDRTDTTSMNFGGSASKDGASGSFGISKSIVTKIGGSFSYSLSWNAGQKIGPYEIQPGYTGEATYGFRTVHLDGTQQYCKPNGTWSNPTPWRVLVPMKNQVEVKVYKDLADSWLGTVPAEQPDPELPVLPELPELPVLPEISEPDTSVAGPEVSDGADKEPEVITEDTTDPDDPAGANATAPQEPAAYDLEPYFTVAAGKSPGFAGLVAIRVKNVGTKRYYQDNLATRFRVDVHTASGPEGVDRLITPGWFNGAYTRDLGFNEATSTRSFEVTLSNTINPGSTQLIANLNFGDGATREGRIRNYITVTQIGRIPGDTSTYNDQNVDSRENTFDHMKRHNRGIF